MNPPWLQLDMGFLEQGSAELAGLLGVTQGDALLLSVRLWKAIVQRINADALDLDAELLGASTIANPNAAHRLAQICGWTNPNVETLVKGLSDRNVRLIEVLPDGAGYRVRGMDRYTDLTERLRRKREYDRKAKALKVAGWKYDTKEQIWYSPGGDKFTGPTAVHEAYDALKGDPERFDVRKKAKGLFAGGKPTVPLGGPGKGRGL